MASIRLCASSVTGPASVASCAASAASSASVGPDSLAVADPEIAPLENCGRRSAKSRCGAANGSSILPDKSASGIVTEPVAKRCSRASMAARDLPSCAVSVTRASALPERAGANGARSARLPMATESWPCGFADSVKLPWPERLFHAARFSTRCCADSSTASATGAAAKFPVTWISPAGCAGRWSRRIVIATNSARHPLGASCPLPSAVSFSASASPLRWASTAKRPTSAGESFARSLTSTWARKSCRAALLPPFNVTRKFALCNVASMSVSPRWRSTFAVNAARPTRRASGVAPLAAISPLSFASLLVPVWRMSAVKRARPSSAKPAIAASGCSCGRSSVRVPLVVLSRLRSPRKASSG